MKNRWSILILLFCFLLTGCKGSTSSVEHKYMVVTKHVLASPVPTSDSAMYDLNPGKVVKLVAETEEWYQIEFFAYAEPIEGEKWVKKEVLAEYDPQLVKEGYLKQDALIYDEQGIVKERGQHNTIFIVGEKGDLYEINAPGGIWGFIRKADFVPNPFRKFDDGEMK